MKSVTKITFSAFAAVVLFSAFLKTIDFADNQARYLIACSIYDLRFKSKWTEKDTSEFIYDCLAYYENICPYAYEVVPKAEMISYLTRINSRLSMYS